MRLLKNTNTRSFSGSAHTQVPVKPVWPNTLFGVDGEHGPTLSGFGSGLSNPKPRRLILDVSVVNKRQVSSLKYLLPLNVPLLSIIW